MTYNLILSGYSICLNYIFSCLQPHRFFTVEQSQSGGGETTAHACTYEIIQEKVNILLS